MKPYSLFIYFQSGNAFEDVVRKLVTTLSRPQYVKPLGNEFYLVGSADNNWFLIMFIRAISMVHFANTEYGFKYIHK